MHEAVAEAEAEGVAQRRVPCRDYPYPTWRYRYARLLRLLETRLATGHKREGALDFISILSIFVLACFVGYYVVWSVTPALHTPLDGGDQRHLLGDHRRRADRGAGRAARCAG